MSRPSLLLLVVPVLAASAWARQSEPPAPAADDAPPLAFSQYAINLGTVQPLPIIGARFAFTNTSSEPVTIVRLEPSCACMRPTLEDGTLPATIAPGESSAITVQMVTANETPGPHLQTVAVRTLGSRGASGERAKHKQTLSFRATLPEQKITLTPNQLLFYQIHAQAGRQTLTFTDKRDNPAKVLRVGVADYTGRDPANKLPTISDWVTLDVVRNEPGDAEVTVSVREGLPSGRRTGFIVFETDDEAQPRHKVPVMLEGKYTPKR